MKENLDKLINESMSLKKPVELSVYRMIKTEFMLFEKSKGAKELTEIDEVKILNKMVNQRKDSIEMFTKANRLDLVEKEKSEIEVIKRHIPEGVSRETIEEYVNELLSINIDPIKGQVIKATKDKFPTEDGKLISEIVLQKMK